MVKAENTVMLSFSSTLTLNETELRALDAIVGYGTEEFLKRFKETMGKAYIEGYEDGVRSLFSTIRTEVKPALNRIDSARKLLKDAGVKIV